MTPAETELKKIVLLVNREDSLCISVLPFFFFPFFASPLIFAN